MVVQKKTGTRLAIVYNDASVTQALSVRLLVTGVEKTLISATVSIYDPGGNAIVTGQAASVSGAVATYATTFPTASYSVNEGYFADWVLSWTESGTQTKRSRIYFDVVFRDFESQLTDEDLTDHHPYIALPSGVTDYSSFRLNAWRKIERIIRTRFSTNPGNLFYQGDFFDVHLNLTLAQYFMANSFQSAGGEDWDKSMYFERIGMEELDVVLSNVAVDMNEPPDGLVTKSEKNYFLGGVELVR